MSIFEIYKELKGNHSYCDIITHAEEIGIIDRTRCNLDLITAIADMLTDQDTNNLDDDTFYEYLQELVIELFNRMLDDYNNSREKTEA